jgi:hypothetical protein
MTTRPSMMPSFTNTVPDADASQRTASATGAALIEPALSKVPNGPFSSTAALPAPVAVIAP